MRRSRRRCAAEGATGGLPCYALGEGLPGHESYEQALAAHPGTAPLPERPLGRDFLYSSGTTGLPKGIRRALIPFADADKPEWDMTWRALYGFDEGMVYLSPAPLYHAAPNRYVQRTLAEGGTAVILRKFDAEAALAAIERFRVTHSQWVPTMFVRMLALPEEARRRHDLSSHRCAIHAAAPCPPAVKRAMIEWWGPILWEYYAGSEGVGTTVIGSEDWLRRPGSVGRPVNGVQRPHHRRDRTRTAARARPARSGSRARRASPTTTRRRRPKPPTTRAAGAPSATSAGWTRTAISSSPTAAPTSILSGGVNLYPAEIEATLAQHPEVAEVAVVGVPHPEFGEQVHAVVVPRAGAETDGAGARVWTPGAATASPARSARAPGSSPRNCRAARPASCCGGC